MFADVGKWEILSEDGRAKDGHSLFSAKCTKCGHVKHAVRLSTLVKHCDGPCCHTNWYPGIPCRLKRIFRNMVSRCYNKNAKDYRFYGQKGVFICDEWFQDPNKFFDWALENGYDDNMTIDRIDPKQCYCPKNCRWIDAKTNAKIKSTTRLVTIDGITDSLSGWASRAKIPKNTLVHWARSREDKDVAEYIKRKKNEIPFNE